MAYLEITDPRGRVWRVWDTHPQPHRAGGVAEAYASGWLTFESDSEKRRLMPVPPRWYERDAAGLLQLLEDAQRVERGGAVSAGPGRLIPSGMPGRGTSR